MAIRLDHYDLVEAVKEHFLGKIGYFVVTEVKLHRPRMGVIDVVALRITSARPAIFSVECEASRPDMRKIIGKLIVAKEVSNAVYLTVPSYVYKEDREVFDSNLRSLGIGLFIVEPITRVVKNVIEVRTEYVPKKRWSELYNKLLEYYPDSKEYIEKAIKKILGT